MILINGLRIATRGDIENDMDLVDVRWDHTPDATFGASCAKGAAIEVRSHPGPEGISTCHMFRRKVGPRCCFVVAPDGRSVQSRSASGVDHENVVELLLEPVMRSILYHRGLASFHASALIKNGRAILLMGQKGAGKSTLSLALQQQGWTLVADDLVRVSPSDQTWHAFSGHRQLKLRDDVLTSLGHAAESLPLRWSNPPSAFEQEKRVIAARDRSIGPLDSFPVQAICFLQGRDPSLQAARWQEATELAAIKELFRNSTPPPSSDSPARPPAYADAVGGLLRQAAMYEVTLPDSLSHLPRAAEALEAMIEH